MLGGDYLVGFSQKVITPPLGVAMAGYSARQGVSQGTHDDLFARALVLYDGATKVALLVCDLLLITGGLVAAVRKRVAEVTDINEHNVLVCATHTHSGPMVWLPDEDREYFFSAGNPVNKHWQEMLPKLLCEVVEDANQSLQPITAIGIGESSATLCANRRMIDPFGNVHLLPNVHKPTDSQIGILEVQKEKNTVLLINYACHPVVLCEDNLLYSGDYPAFAITYMEQRAERSFKVIFTNGACGNLDPLIRGDFNKASEMGKFLAETVLNEVSKLKSLNQLNLAVNSFIVSLPLKNLPTRDELQQYVKRIRDILDRHGNNPDFHFQRLKNEYDLALQKLYLLEQAYKRFPLRADKGAMEAEIQIIKLNKEIALIGIPGELFNEIGKDIKLASPFSHTYILGCCNDYIGYIPTAQAYIEGGYEVQGTFLAQGAAEQLRQSIINKLMEVKKL